MSKHIPCLIGVIPVILWGLPVHARPQPYSGQPGESPQLVKCKQEAQYLGASGRNGDTQGENNRLMRKEFISKCMKGQ